MLLDTPVLIDSDMVNNDATTNGALLLKLHWHTISVA